MKHLFLLLALTISVQAQTFTDLFDSKSVNSTTTNSNTIFALTTSSGSAFDTLKVLVTAGSDLTTDSAAFAVYVQSYVLGSWSQGILVDSIRTAGSRLNHFAFKGVDSTLLLADTIQARWFYGQTLATEAQNAIKNRSDWKYRVYIIGKPYGNSINLSGGTAKVSQIKW